MRPSKLAEEVGYDKVSDLAKGRRHPLSVRPHACHGPGFLRRYPHSTMAAAYYRLCQRRSADRPNPDQLRPQHQRRGLLKNYAPGKKKSVLDPRVAAVMTNMMEAVD